MEIAYGPILLKKKDVILLEYLKNLKERYVFHNKSTSVDKLNKKISELDRVIDIIVTVK